MAIGQHVKRALEEKARIDDGELDAEPQEPQTPTTTVDPALAQMVALAVAEAMKPLIGALGAIVQGQGLATAEAVKAARTKRPESYLGDFPHPNISHFTPDGRMLPPLTCETFLGYWEQDELTGQLQIIPGYPYIAEETGGCTLEEREVLNRIQAGIYTAHRRDGVKGQVRVQVRHDTDGQPYRKTIAVPKTWLTKQMKNMIGGIEFLRQLDPAVAVPAATEDAVA